MSFGWRRLMSLELGRILGVYRGLVRDIIN
jgi:hypothetical protein